MNLSDKVAIPSLVMARQVGDETVILDLTSGTYYGLDAVGARIWQLMAEGQTLAGVISCLLSEYDVAPESLERDLDRLLHELSDKKLISLVS